MSDYEEEHFPVGIRTSFSSSFDADWRESAGVTDFAPIRRSFSEFYRGERITVDTVSHNFEDELQNYSSKEELQNYVDDDSDLDNLNGSHRMNVDSASSCVAATKNNISSDVQSRSYQPEFDMQIDSFVSEHCSSIKSECLNGYHNKESNNETKIMSHTDSGVSTVTLTDSLTRTVAGMEIAQSPCGAVNDVVRHRAVSEIRNNIPDVGSVKSYGDSGSEVRQPSPDTVLRGEFARFRKRSPGVAKRLEATTPSQGESIDTSVLSIAEVCETDENALVGYKGDSYSTQPSTLFMSSIAACSRMNVTLPAANASIEKEAAKLRNIVDSSQMSRMWESLSDVSAQRTDPFRYSGMLPDAVLFTTCDDPVADQTIRLSPELTECDSDNVSTLEEDSVVDVVDGCLPVVEDGLSCSDTDEMVTSAPNSSPPSNFSSAAHSDVAADNLHKFPVSETEVMDFFSGTADTSCVASRVKDDAVERAIRDIRLAMERSKGLAARSPGKCESLRQQSSRHNAESVWVSRAE